MSFRRRINSNCKKCVYDPLDLGTCAQQIACCINTECDFHEIRPITTSAIPMELLDRYRLLPKDLDDRARVLVVPRKVSSGEGQNASLVSTESIPLAGDI
jgi:hypothetical protein